MGERRRRVKSRNMNRGLMGTDSWRLTVGVGMEDRAGERERGKA